jgi:hypothetical protein
VTTISLRELKRETELALQLRELRVVVRKNLPDKLLEVRRSAPVIRIWFEDERGSVVPRLEDERAARNWSAVDRGLIEIGCVSKRMRRQRRIRRAPHGKHIEGSDARLFQVNDDRVRVGRFGGRDVTPAIVRFDVVLRIVDGAIGIYPIGRRQRLPVGPARVLA